MINIFNYYNACLNLIDNKVSIIDRKFNDIDLEYNIDNIINLNIKLKTEKLIKFIVNNIPFSLIRTRILILLPSEININILHEIEEIIYKNSKNRFREMIFVNDGNIIINLYEEWNKCIYLIDIKDKILGFSACAGQAITDMLYFNNNNSIEYMIEQIKNGIYENSLNKLKAKIKNMDIDTLWKDEKIIISFNPEKFKNNHVQNIQNNYIPDILNLGLIKYIERYKKNIFE